MEMVTNGGSTPGSKGDGGGFVLLAEPASLPSLISSFFTQNKGGGGGGGWQVRFHNTLTTLL